MSAFSILDSVTSSMISTNFVIDKLRRNLKARSLKVKELCGVNGKTNPIELKNAFKRLDMTSKEVDILIEMLSSTNNDGLLDLNLLEEKLQRLE